ncbi:TPA: type V toxin-antitoxin system endoribonuclease antitoxin GhoS [Klebsiella pneumoniae]
MSNEITAWVVSVTFHEQALTEINEVSNHFTRAGFVLTLNDEEGTPHELGTNTFGLLSGQTAEEVKALSAGLAEAALGRPAEIAVVAFAEWLKAQ